MILQIFIILALITFIAFFLIAKIVFKIIIAAVFILMIVFILIFNPILYPAYLSTAQACHPLDNILAGTGYVMAGSFNSSETNCNASIQVISPDPMYLKHEQCHQQQYEQGRLYGCQFGGIMLYSNELECYIRQYL